MKMRQVKFWRSLERLADGAVMREWQEALGSELEPVRAFLQLSDRVADTVPCKTVFGCGFPHRVEECGSGWIAVSDGDDGCPAFSVTPDERRVYCLNLRGLCGAIAQALGLRSSGAAGKLQARAVRVGQHGFPAADVFLMLPGEIAWMAREVERLFGDQPEPFVLLTPTGAHCSQEILSMLRRQRCVHFALSEIVEWQPDGLLKAVVPPDALLPGHTAGIIAPRYLFKRIGRAWEVIFDGSPRFLIDDTLGAKYLDYLFRHPNTTVKPFDLETAIRPEKAMGRSQTFIDKSLDSRAIQEMLKELTRLRREREEAVDDGDLAEVDNLDNQIGAIEAAMQKKAPADTGEKARLNVTKAIAAVRKACLKGEKHEKAFAGHIGQYVSTGYDVCYNQPMGKIWA